MKKRHQSTSVRKVKGPGHLRKRGLSRAGMAHAQVQYAAAIRALAGINQDEIHSLEAITKRLQARRVKD